ncbi:hypothetical protein [Janibacter cremeus]|uniref:Proline dehydrogenase n=1 Tax=Janibacter cremeus TaxID=1285192 RepID=A0A852VPB3_9MICO|nr:hypothetical protein [Janibacter cremeus]NYF98867.1 proline dehydrogenase [Janibacter cremeus]
MSADRLRARTLDALLAPDSRDRVAASRAVTSARARFVAGEGTDDAVAQVQRLRRTNRLAAIHPLLPPAEDAAGVDATITDAVTAIERLAPVAAGGDYRPEIYLAPEQLGIATDTGRAARALAEVCAAGDEHRVDITLRSGTAPAAEATLDLVESTRERYPRLTASVVARRHRSEGDVARLTATGTRVRLVRGGVGDPASEAWQDPHEADLAFVRCLADLLGSGVHTVVATHEPLLLDLADGLADQSGRGPEGLEYQFFLGAQPELQMRTADAGHRVRVLVPYGPQWLEYLHDLARRPSGMRRLATMLAGRG